MNIDQIVSVGSVDGICTTAAVVRNAVHNVDIVFAQAFTVDKVDPSSWTPNRNVLFIDLAVNNRDPEMTAGFIRRVIAAGHTIVGVLDEHNAEDWKKAFEAAEVSFDDLAIKPVSQDQGEIKSSGALLLSLISDIDQHTHDLCEAADAGDHMDFSTHFGGFVNQAVKSKIGDDSRRIYLANYFARKREPDETIRTWIAEYEEILKSHEEIVAARQDQGDGIVRISALGKTVDMTTLMKTVYDLGYSVVLTEGETYNKTLGKTGVQIAFGCKPGLQLDTVATIKAAGINCSGFAAKANINPHDEKAALVAIRQVLIG